MFSSNLKIFNKINLLPLRNVLFYETKPKYSLYSIILRQRSNVNKKSNLHERIIQSEKDIKKLEQKILAFDKKVEISESESSSPLPEDYLSKIYETISAPPEPSHRHQLKSNLKLSITDEKKFDSFQFNQGLYFPSVSDLEASKQEQIYMLTRMKKENLKSIGQFNDWLYACVLTRRADEALNVLLLMEKAGVTPNIITYDHLINLYASVGDLQKAIGSFDLIEPAGLKPTVYSYANLIKAYNKHNRVDDAFNVYLNMKNNGLIPTQPVYTTLIKGCIDSGEIKRAWTTFDIMRLEVCQPDEITFSLMIHVCAKEENVERAFDLYQEMKERGLSPTDVTFNSLIHACAKRKDYYEEAFKLLQEMREYGYQPDITTCNSLMVACSKKGDLQMARNLLITMMQSSKTYPSLTPDELTFTNLFWTYSTYKEPMNYISRSQHEKILRDKQLEDKEILSSSENDSQNDFLKLSYENQKDLLKNEIIDDIKINKELQSESELKISEEIRSENTISKEIRSENTISKEIRSEDTISKNNDLLTARSDTYPLLKNLPTTFSQTVKEAEMIFNYIIKTRMNPNMKITTASSSSSSSSSSPNINLSPKLIISYLNVLIKKSRYNNVYNFYRNFIPKYNIKLNGWIFLNGLIVCYKHKKIDESWSIWRDWESWKKDQIKEIEKNYDDEYSRKDSFKKIGLTESMEYEIYKLMIKILSRCNEVQCAIRLLQNLSTLQRPNIQDFTLLLQKCVENEDEISHRKVINLCYNYAENNNVLQSKNLLTKKWKGRGIKLPPKNRYDERERFRIDGNSSSKKRSEYYEKDGYGRWNKNNSRERLNRHDRF